MSKEKQTTRLLDWLAAGNSINPLDSWRFLGIYRLSARIHDLKQQGWDIKTERIEVKSEISGATARVAQYSLNSSKALF